MTIREALNLHEDSLILLSFVLNKDKAWLLANQDKKITKIQDTRYKKLIQKRKKHLPVAYLTGEKEFYGFKFKVTPDVLIPRPDSELLVELALNRIKNQELRIKNIIDVGTGAGNLIISIAKNLQTPVIASPVRLRRTGEAIPRDRHGAPAPRPFNRVQGDLERSRNGRNDVGFFATDISEKALKIARQNAKAHKMSDKIKFIKGDLLDSVISDKGLEISDSLILANLPYLSNKQINNLTIKHEPKVALYGGKDGLKYFRELFDQLTKSGIQNSIIFLEHDPSQKKSLESLAKKHFPKLKNKSYKDLSGKYRVLEINPVRSSLKY